MDEKYKKNFIAFILSWFTFMMAVLLTITRPYGKRFCCTRVDIKFLFIIGDKSHFDNKSVLTILTFLRIPNIFHTFCSIVLNELFIVLYHIFMTFMSLQIPHSNNDFSFFSTKQFFYVIWPYSLVLGL